MEAPVDRNRIVELGPEPSKARLGSEPPRRVLWENSERDLGVSGVGGDNSCSVCPEQRESDMTNRGAAWGASIPQVSY